MVRYIHTEALHSPQPDEPKWLNRRWRYQATPSIEPSMRRVLVRHALREYGPKCHWCGRHTYFPTGREQSGNRPDHLTLEHLVARGMGGKDTFANTRIACYECNSSRSVAQAWEIWWHRLKIMAPNKLFGTYIIGEDAV